MTGQERQASRPRAQAHTTARTRRHDTRRRRQILRAVGALFVVGATVAITASLARRAGTSAAQDAAPGHNAEALPGGYRLTGETSPMGAPVLVTPGTRSGAAAAAGVVVDGADLAMGRIPLAYAVNPTWQLTNTSDQPVTLGKPQLEIVRGCCPGELALGTTTLQPGAHTDLQFPLQMHPGMDGEHLFRIAVPVEGAATPLVLSVAGDFR